jgi:protein SCO1/2
VLTPNGKVARYFFGVNFPAKELGVTLREAAVEHTGSPVEQLLLLCFHYNPLRGKYGALIMTVFRVGGLLTVGALFYAVFRIRQRDALAPRSNVPGGGSAAADRKPEPAGKEES